MGKTLPTAVLHPPAGDAILSLLISPSLEILDGGQSVAQSILFKVVSRAPTIISQSPGAANGAPGTSVLAECIDVSPQPTPYGSLGGNGVAFESSRPTSESSPRQRPRPSKLQAPNPRSGVQGDLQSGRRTAMTRRPSTPLPSQVPQSTEQVISKAHPLCL